MKKVIAIWAPALIILAACWFGYSHYKIAPVGDLFYTPAPGICPNYNHSFTTGYALTLFFSGIVWLLALVGFWIVSRLAKSDHTRARSRSLIPSTLLGIAIFALFWLLHPIAERLLPLEPSPCAQHGP